MSAFNGLPYAGPLQISLDDCKNDLIDLPPHTLNRLRRAKPGIENVCNELQNTIPAYGQTAGLAPDVLTRFVANNARINRLTVHEAELEKALEVVRETRALAEHERENTVAFIVDVVKSTAQRSGDAKLLASFEKTVEYNAQTAVKGARTRRKKSNGEKTPLSE